MQGGSLDAHLWYSSLPTILRRTFPLGLAGIGSHPLIIAFSCVLTPLTLRAQNQPAAGVIQGFSTLEPHEYDTINLATLQVQLNVPVRSKAGHIPFSFLLRGGAGVTYRTTMGADGQLRSFFSGGANLVGIESHVGSPGTGGSLAAAMTQTKLCAGSNHTGYSEWVYSDLNGGSHPVALPVLWTISTCGPTSGAGYTTDGSGIYVSADWSGTGYAIDLDGNKVLFGAGSTYTYTDPNGNAITYSTVLNGSTRTNTYTDTLAQTPATITAVTSTSGTLKETDTWTDAAGTSRQIKLYTITHPLLTSFGCSLDQALPAINTPFSDHVSFPDSSTLTYTYEKNYSNSSDYTGRLASITLPTGGQITYAYSGGTHGINCIDATNATVKRTTPDGLWTYVHTPPQTYGGSPTTTQVTDPLGNNTVYTFVSAALAFGEGVVQVPLQTQKKVYNGTVLTANLAQTIITCYNNPTSTPTNCNASPLQYPITQKDDYTTYPNVTGYAAVKTTYDTYGRITDVKTYDFNASTPTNEKVIAYGSGNPTSGTCTAISTYIIGKPCSVTLYDSQHSNAILSQTWNNYNGSGNLLQSWNLVSGSGSTGTYLSKQYTYDSAGHGVVQTMTDVNGQVINYTTTSCNNMFVTSQYPTNFPNLLTSQTWDCNGGVVTSSTDANGKTTYVDYYVGAAADPFYRPLDTKDEQNNITTLSYPTPNQTESVFSFNGGLSVIDTVSTTDSIGRPVTSQLSQGPGSPNWDTRSRTFDGDGHPYQNSLPCVTAAKGTGCSASTEFQTYDGLNRPLVHTGTGGDVVTKTYYANDVTIALTPAPANEHAKTVHKEYDGLGRLKSVCLISSATGSGPCGQATAGTGFLTTYTYDAAGRLLQTIENAQVSSPRQSRTYAYDLLGRVASETNPESGTTTYFWDAAPPICWNNQGWATPGDIGAKMDNAGNYICYGYDGLHRLAGTLTRPSGPCMGFIYDSATPPSGSGITVTNTAGHVVEAYTNSDCNGTTNVVTDEWFGYSPRGELTDFYESTPHSGGSYYHLSATHWEDGQIKAVTGVGLPTITYGATDGSGLDGEGRVTKVNASSGTNPVSGVTYDMTNDGNPVGSLLKVTLGLGDTQNFTYYKNTGRMNTYSASVGSSPVVITGTLTWSYNGTLAENNIVDGYNPLNTQDCKYLYDDFVRVASGLDGTPGVNCLNVSTKIWNQTFSYGSDSFGNLTKTTTGPGLAWACTACYNSATNQYNSTLSPNIVYDADGRLTNDTFHTYTWNLYGQVATIDSNTITYDANGNKVEENVGGTIHEYVSAFGVSAQMTGQTENSTLLDLPGGVQAIYSGGTLKRFRFPDWQGTIRAESDPTLRQFTESLAFAPFGERYALKGAPFNVDSFTGKPDQIVRDEYDFPARQEHNGQGRWISPDPMHGTGNKYAYGGNNPLSKIDLYGLYAMEINGIFVSSNDVWLTGGLDAESHASVWKQLGGNPDRQIDLPDVDWSAFRHGDYIGGEPQTPEQQQKKQADNNTDAGQHAKEEQKEDEKKSTGQNLHVCGDFMCNSMGVTVMPAPASVRGLSED